MAELLDGELFERSLGAVSVVVSARPIEALTRPLDAIVSSDDTHLSMSGGVSAAILKAAGPAIKREAQELLPVRIGDVCVTKGSALPVKHILHAVTVDWDKGVRPTERTVRQLSKEIFRRCEILGIHTLGVPALGTGAAKFDADHSARLTIEALGEHAKNPTSLRTVLFSLPEEAVRNAFVQYITTAPGLDRLRESRRLQPLERSQLGAPPASPLHAREFLAAVRSSTETANAGVAASLPPPAALPTVPHDPSAQSEGKLGDSRPVLNSRYVLLEELGRGGMGIVHLAWDLRLKRTFAIKTLRNYRPRDRSLEHEATIWIGLNHEGIVRLHHFEAHDPSFGPYLVIEYVDWLTGDKWISNAGSRGLPVGAVMSVGTKLCRALAYAHERHVLHGDIKPANFFVDHAAESAKLSDWGLARLGRFETSESLLLRVEGTPAYMAPEQREPGRKIGPATDVYLLAASLWECLMGDVPPKDALRAALVNDERLPAARTLQNALLADPAARPTAAEFARMLSSVAGRSAYAS